MKIQLRTTPGKTAIEIDPVENPKFFAPLIAVVIYYSPDGDRTPRIISTYAGQMNSADAGAYGEALCLASLLCERANKGEALITIYETLEHEGQRRVPNQKPKQSLTH